MGKVSAKTFDGVSIDAVVDLTSRLIQAKSENPPGHEEEAAETLAESARRWGLNAHLETVEPGRVNVLISSTDADSTKGLKIGPLLYCGHLDTVPAGGSDWQREPFSGEVRNGRVFGRGSVDMKGGLAAMLGGLAMLKE